MHLYETHLPVTSTLRATNFYVDVVGFRYAHRDPSRDIVFLWIGLRRNSMLGLWGPGTQYGTPFRKCHLGISIPLPELLEAGKRLNEKGLHPYDFTGKGTTEPSVIGWMPSAQLYFEDPDGHCVEFITLLEDEPVPSFFGPLSHWQSSQRHAKERQEDSGSEGPRSAGTRLEDPRLGS